MVLIINKLCHTQWLLAADANAKTTTLHINVFWLDLVWGILCDFYSAVLPYTCITRNQDLGSCSTIWDMSLWDEPNIVCIVASITIEVKNCQADVTKQRILNKFIDFFFLCDVWFGPDCCLFQPLLLVKILI